MEVSHIPLVAAALVGLIVGAIWCILTLRRELKAEIPAEVWAEARQLPLLPPNERWRLSPEERAAARARRERLQRENTAA
jgi:hypothetical protein